MVKAPDSNFLRNLPLMEPPIKIRFRIKLEAHLVIPTVYVQSSLNILRTNMLFVLHK